MFIFGITERVLQTSQHGQFFCPNCQVTTTYAECRRKSYLHIFFIPLIPCDNDPAGIQCCNCLSEYDDPSVSEYNQQALATWQCSQCKRTWPETNVRCPICKIRPDAIEE